MYIMNEANKKSIFGKIFMQNNPHGIIVKVENLDLCRSFYRDILNLGSPVIDSNFWVEFYLNDNVSLVLEKIETGERLSVRKGRVSWLYYVDDIEAMIKRLEDHGVEPFTEIEERIGYKVVRFNDPEGNPFYLYSSSENSNTDTRRNIILDPDVQKTTKINVNK